MKQHPIENLPAYALGCLEPAEAEMVGLHLAGCPACCEELNAWEQTADLLIHAVPVAEPPAALDARLMASIRPVRSYPWFERLLQSWPRLVPAAGVAALLLVLISGLINLALLRQVDQGNVPDLAGVQLARFAGTEVMPAASGVLMVAEDAKEGVLLVSAMQPLEAHQQYQLWLIRNGQRTSGGVFSVSAEGEARLLVASEIPLTHYDAFGVTIEPYGGSVGPTGPKVLGGTI